MKKIEETKETVKSTEFATTIYRIRQERKLTQQYQTYVRLGIFAKN